MATTSERLTELEGHVAELQDALKAMFGWVPSSAQDVEPADEPAEQEAQG